MSRWGEIPLPCFLPAVCLSVGPFIRRSVRLFFAPLEVLRGFQSHGGREERRDQLATRTRAAGGRRWKGRQRRPWPGEGPERMRLRANWKLVFPLSLPSSPLRSSSFGVCPDTEAALASFLLPMGRSSAAPPARARPVCPCVCACEFAPNQEQLPLNPRCRIDLFFSSRINYFPRKGSPAPSHSGRRL